MKKLIRGLSAAMLACLCAGPVLAQSPGSFTAPGLSGALVPYPHVDSAPIAQAPQDEFAPLWNSFYRADLSAQVLWDKLYWQGGSQESGDPALLDSTVLDRNMVFCNYTLFAQTPEEISALVKALDGGTRLCGLLPEAAPGTDRRTVYRDRETGSVLGEASLEHHDTFKQDVSSPTLPVECWSVWYWLVSPENRGDFSYRLELTDDLKSQLKRAGLHLENTRAFSVILPGYATGFLFDDGAGQFFFPVRPPETSAYASMPPDGVAPKGDLNRVPGRTDQYMLTVPVEKPSLPLGKLAPVSGLLKDLKRISNGGWYYITEKRPLNTGKPVIYLYPEKETDVSVRLKFDGELTYTYPAYGGGWDVTAYPGGRIVNKPDGSEHYYLFWEGISDTEWTFDRGFCVPGADTETFLRDALPKLGLTPREYNDFITYWVPKLRQNPYNLIKFADAEYERLASLTVTPKPDTIARIHMVYRPLEKPVDIPPQTLSGFDRKGFTVVEWGGTEAGQNARIQSIVLKRGFS